jgi:hypothetical protein
MQKECPLVLSILIGSFKSQNFRLDTRFSANRINPNSEFVSNALIPESFGKCTDSVMRNIGLNGKLKPVAGLAKQ